MPKAIVDQSEFESLPEPLQSEYDAVEGTETYQLRVDPVNGYQLADVTKLQKALEAERKTARDASSKLKQFSDLDPNAAREALEFKSKFESGDLPDDAAAKLKAREEQLVAKYEDQRKSLEQMIKQKESEWTEREQRLVSGLQDARITSVVRSAIASHDGVRELLEPMVTSRVKLVEEEGQFVTKVLDDKGNTMLSRKPGSTTDPMDVDEFVGLLRQKQEFAGAFKGSGSSGGGSSGGDGPRSQGNTITLTREQAKDVMKYRQARELAAKSGKQLVVAD